MVSKFFSSFYSQLYTSTFNVYMSSCEMDLSLEELNVIIHKSPLNKSPGLDGLPFEFYRTFWQDIK